MDSNQDLKHDKLRQKVAANEPLRSTPPQSCCLYFGNSLFAAVSSSVSAFLISFICKWTESIGFSSSLSSIARSMSARVPTTESSTVCVMLRIDDLYSVLQPIDKVVTS